MNQPFQSFLRPSVSQTVLNNEWDTIRVMEDILRGTSERCVAPRDQLHRHLGPLCIDSRQPHGQGHAQEAMDVCDNDADSTTTATVNSFSSSSDGSTVTSSFQSYQTTSSSSALLPTAVDQAALPVTLPVASKATKSREWEPSLIQIMRERPDVMQNHNNVRNQAPR